MDVRMPDGTVVTNVPEGITKEELTARLGKANLGAAASFDLPGETSSASRSDYFINSAKRGVENLLSAGPAVLDILTGAQGNRDALRILGKGEPPPTLTQELQRGYRGLTGMDPNMQAPDELTRYGGKALEFAVSGSPFSAATIAKGVHRLPAAMAELGSAAGGGVGFELGGDIGGAVGGETGKAVGEFVGSLGGSIAGLATPVTFSKVWALAGPNLSQQGRASAVQALAGQRLAGPMAANPQTGANMLNAEQVIAALQQKGAGTFRPTIGQMTGAEGVQSIEGAIARKTPEDLGRYAQRATENRQVIERARDIDFPPGGDFQRGAESVARQTTKRLDDRLEALTAMQERLASRVEGTGQQAAGERLQELRAAAQQAAKASRDAKVRDIYATADRLGIREDMGDVVAVVRRVGGADSNTFQSMPPVFRKVMDEYAPKEMTGRYVPPDLMQAAGMVPKAASFQEVHSLYRETNSQLATAQRVGDQNASYFLGQLKDALKAKLDKYEQAGQGELSEKFRAFNEWFSTRYAPAFYEGVGGRMSATSRFGEVVKPEQVVGKFFTPSGVDDFNLIYQGNRDAQNALRDGVLGLFAEKAIKDGRIDQRAAQTFLRANRETLDKLPDIKATLSDAAAINEALLARSERLRSAQTDVAKSTVARIANTENPDALVQAALSDKQKILGLISAAKDPSSRQSVLRSIAENVPIAAAKEGMDPLTFVSQHESALRPALNRLGPQHYDNLKILANAETIMGRADVPGSAITPKMTSFVEEATGSTPRTIWAQTANTSAGRQSPVSAVLHLLSRYGIKVAENRTDDVLREVIYNPDLARALIRASSNQRFNATASNRVLDHLRNAGIRTLIIGGE